MATPYCTCPTSSAVARTASAAPTSAARAASSSACSWRARASSASMSGEGWEGGRGAGAPRGVGTEARDGAGRPRHRPARLHLRARPDLAAPAPARATSPRPPAIMAATIPYAMVFPTHLVDALDAAWLADELPSDGGWWMVCGAGVGGGVPGGGVPPFPLSSRLCRRALAARRRPAHGRTGRSGGRRRPGRGRPVGRARAGGFDVMVVFFLRLFLLLFLPLSPPRVHGWMVQHRRPPLPPPLPLSHHRRTPQSGLLAESPGGGGGACGACGAYPVPA